MKKIVFMIMILTVFVILVGCSSDSDLTPEEQALVQDEEGEEALAGQAVARCRTFPDGDLNKDCRVNEADANCLADWFNSWSTGRNEKPACAQVTNFRHADFDCDQALSVNDVYALNQRVSNGQFDDAVDTPRKDGKVDCWLVDSDGDNVRNKIDTCPAIANLKNVNIADPDRDGFGAACDNCPDISNSQRDEDGDGVGDLCEFRCRGAVPANAQLCAGDDVDLIRSTDSTLAPTGCTPETKCEYTCNMGFNVVNGVCVAAPVQFCRYGGSTFSGPTVETEQGSFARYSCQNNRLTTNTCVDNQRVENNQTCPDFFISPSFGCNAAGTGCCNIWEGMVYNGPADALYPPRRFGNATAANLRCEGSVFLNETSTTCGIVTLSKDCAIPGYPASHCDVAQGGCVWR